MLRLLRDHKMRSGFLALSLALTLGISLSSLGADVEMVFLRVPTSCLRLDSVEGSKIYLKSGQENCSGTPSMLPVAVEPAIKRVAVYIDGIFREEQDVERFDVKSSGVRSQEEARKTLDYYQSESFRKKYEAEIERLKTTVFKDTLNAYYGEAKESEKSDGKGGMLSDKERIYLFVSSSMPAGTLRKYAADLDKLGDPHIVVVMRGFVGGMKYVKPTLAFVRKVVTKDPNCDPDKTKCEAYRVAMNIDPLLFRRYGINRVPAVVYVPDVSVTDASLSEGWEENAKAGDHLVLYGDASLDYILDAFHRESGRKSLEHLRELLKGGIYGKVGKE